jgi:ABC-type branched-subunit amino acid transport system substrate-binding protein
MLLVNKVLTLLCAWVTSAAPIPLKIGVVLGLNNNTADTSDQEQWCFEQARSDISKELAASGAAFALETEVVFAGEDTESAAAIETIREFIVKCAGKGIGYFVGAYVSDVALLALKETADDNGMAMLMPACGLPDFPAPRENVFRFWPNDRYQARVLADHIQVAQKAEAVVVMSRSDVTGVGLTSTFADLVGKGLMGKVQWYNHSKPDDYMSALKAILSEIDAAPGDLPIGFLCNCGNEEVADILDAMKAMNWPAERTFFTLTDRATPTRSVAAPVRRPFAASVHASGVLSHIPTQSNPAYERLFKRWRADGQTTSLFASAVASYDALRMAARASMLLGGGSTAGDLGKLAAALNATALDFWGVSGMMALDEHGDLYRAEYDVYALNSTDGWFVDGAPVDAHTLPASRERSDL